jgi:PIN domain
MLRLLLDTSVLLDLAQRRDGQKWIVPMRVLIHQGHLQLLVPALIIDEFERNRPRAEHAVTARVRERFRLLRSDLDAYASDDQRSQWIEEIAHHIPLVSAMTLRNFSEISELLQAGRVISPTNLDYERVVQRGLQKKAPLYLDKNSVADTLLIELYASVVKRSRAKKDQYWFATSNYQDFSVPNGDRRLPHPDLSELFSDDRCRYVYGEEGLKSAFEDYFGDVFIELAEETEFLQEEPRTFAEIIEAEQEFFDRVWYVRSIVHADTENEDVPPDVREGASAARKRVEEKYGRDELWKAIGGGHDEAWEYGYISGKLATLRWVLGDEWDFLDT